MKEKMFMMDIETTGVNQLTDEILEVGLVEIEYDYPYWYPTGRHFHRVIHYHGKPVTAFAKQHQKDLYDLCNEARPDSNYETVGEDLRDFVHDRLGKDGKLKEEALLLTDCVPKLFIGWNASNFDVPFMFNKKMLTPSYYKEEKGKEVLKGDVHYRIYEQTGSLQVLCDITGLNRKTIETLAMDLNPTQIELPEGKAHDAMYDCYRQIIMQNGLIAIGRMGIKK